MSIKENGISGVGIDTTYERSFLTYRPDIKEKERKKTETYYPETEFVLEKNITPLKTETIAGVVVTLQELTQSIVTLEETIVEKIKDDKIPLKDNKEELKDAALELGFTIETDIPFDLYKEALLLDGKKEADDIRDAVEDYYADVHGTMAGEMYADIIDMKKQVDELVLFSEQALYPLILSQDEIPTMQSNKEQLEIVEEKEKEFFDVYIESEIRKRKKEDEYEELLLMGDTSSSLFEKEEEFLTAKSIAEQKERLLQTKAEVTDVIISKTGTMNSNVKLMSQMVSFEAFKGKEKDMIAPFIKKIATTDKIFQQSLTKTMLGLRISFDKQKMESLLSLVSTRTMMSSDKQKRMQDEVVNAIWLRKEVLHSLQSTIDTISESELNYSSERFIETLTNGMYELEGKYQLQVQDLYTIHEHNDMLRTDRLGVVLDKNGTRKMYNIIDKIIEKIQRGEASSSDLSWLDELTN